MAIDKKRGVDRIMVDLPLALAAKVQRIAEQERRSRNFVMCDLIIKGLSDGGPPGVEEEQVPYEPPPKPKKSKGGTP